MKAGPSQSQSSGVGVSSAKYSRSSAGGMSGGTPPTSDPISVDVDMEDEEEDKGKRTKKTAVTTPAPVSDFHLFMFQVGNVLRCD